VFRRQLEAWAPERAWPADRSLEALRAWFDIEFVPAVDDLRDWDLRPDVTCGPFSLRQLIDEVDIMPLDAALFVDVQKGTIVGFTDDEIGALEEGQAHDLGISEDDLVTMREVYESTTLVEVMRRDEFREFDVMLDFTESLPAGSIKNRVADALRGKKPFRRFKDAVNATGLQERWYAWRESALSELIQEVFGDLNIPVDNDLDRPRLSSE
jgi:hypothetical protein